MANRAQKLQHDLCYRFIAERDGEYCIACFVETGQKRGPGAVKLEIDHADNNPCNWVDVAQLHLVCKTHNIKFRSLSVKQHLSLMATYSAENEKERVKKNESKSISRREGLYAIGSPEMQVNSVALGMWRDFVNGWITTNRSIPKDVAINAGALVANDVDPQTTERYYRKDASIAGPYKEIKKDGVKYLVFRDMERDSIFKLMKIKSNTTKKSQSAPE